MQMAQILEYSCNMNDIVINEFDMKYNIKVILNKYKFNYDIVIEPNRTISGKIKIYDKTINRIKRVRMKVIEFINQMSNISSIKYGNCISNFKDNPHKIIIEDINGKELILFGGLIQDTSDIDGLTIICNNIYVYDPYNKPYGKTQIISRRS